MSIPKANILFPMAITTLLCGTCTSMQKHGALHARSAAVLERTTLRLGFWVQGALHSLSRPNDTSAMIASQVVDSRQRERERERQTGRCCWFLGHLRNLQLLVAEGLENKRVNMTFSARRELVNGSVLQAFCTQTSWYVAQEHDSG